MRTYLSKYRANQNVAAQPAEVLRCRSSHPFRVWQLLALGLLKLLVVLLVRPVQLGRWIGDLCWRRLDQRWVRGEESQIVEESTKLSIGGND